MGSWAVEALARSGVCQLSLIDLDQVAESNINRQIQALDTTVGQAKVTALQERIALINPQCRVNIIEEWVTPDNVHDLLGALGSLPHAIIDACDQVKAKVALALWAREHDVLFVGVGAAGGKSAAHRVAIDDLARITHDPLLAQVRQRLRKAGAPQQGRPMKWSYVYSTEPVAASALGDSCDATLNCSGYGSLVSVTATFGFCAAGWVMEKLAHASLQKS